MKYIIEDYDKHDYEIYFSIKKIIDHLIEVPQKI